MKAEGLFVGYEAYEELKEQNDVLDEVRNEAAKSAMAEIALLPIIMGVCYIGLTIYFGVYTPHSAGIAEGAAKLLLGVAP